MADAQRRGRTMSRESHVRAKLTMVDAERIRELCRHMQQKAVARVFGVNPSTVSLIVNRKSRGGWV